MRNLLRGLGFREVDGNLQKERRKSLGVCGMYEYRFIKYVERLSLERIFNYLDIEF